MTDHYEFTLPPRQDEVIVRCFHLTVTANKIVVAFPIVVTT